MTHPSRRAAAALLAFVTLAWGLAWPVTKVAVSEAPVWHLRAITTLAAALLMLSLARLLGQRLLPSGRELVRLALVAQLNITGWVILSGYGVSLMQAGRAAIIGFTMPVWAAALGVAIGQERMTRIKLAALLLAGAGLAALIVPEWQELAARPFGVVAMLAAAISWAAGVVAMKQVRWSLPSGAQAGWQLFLAGLAIAVLTPFAGEEFSPAQLDAAGWAAMLYLIVVSMVLATWAWFTVVALLPATVAGIGVLAVPVVGIVGGALWLGERVGWSDVSALLLIGGAVALAMKLQEDRAGAPQVPAGACLDPEPPG